MSKLKELLKIARHQLQKAAFVDAATAGGGGMPPGGGAPPGMDPAAMGGMPPPGGDPMAAAGGAPPPGQGGGGGDPGLSAKLDQMMTMMQAGGGAGGSGAGALKPKIDVNVELMQIKNMLAKSLDAQGVHIPAQDMVATPEKLMAMSQGQSTLSGAGAGGAGGAGGGSSIPPIEPMQGASPGMAAAGGGGGGMPPGGGGEKASFAKLAQVGNRAAALIKILEQKRA
jgi:hypothetical protein